MLLVKFILIRFIVGLSCGGLRSFEVIAAEFHIVVLINYDCEVFKWETGRFAS